MTHRLNWIGPLCVLALLVVLGSAYIWRSFQPNAFTGNSAYRLTAEAIVDGHHVHAAEVYAYSCMSWRNAGQQTEMIATPCTLAGQALRLDLGQRGSLFITMTGWNSDHSGFSGADVLVHRLLFEAQHGHTVSLADMPIIVRFDNPADATTAHIVDPAHIDRSFGPNATLTALTIDRDTPRTPSDKIDVALPWLKRINGEPLSTEPGDPALRLHDYDFKWPPQ